VARPRLYDDTTRLALVRAVAEAVVASTTAIYGLFGSKAELVRAMYVAGFEHLEAELHGVPTSDDPLVDLLDLGLAYRRSAVDEPHLYDVMFACPVPEFVPDEADAALAVGTLDVLRGGVRRVVETGGLPRGTDVEEVTLGLWALVHGLASLELVGALGDRGEAFWRTYLTATVRGLTLLTGPG
jgi:AcrR family transcriptional regulator